jgi:hypothetical protein
MIYAGQHLLKHKADVENIVGGVKNILADWTPPASGGIVALSDQVDNAMSDAEVKYEAAGLRDFFGENKDVIRMIIEFLLKAKLGI